jgi:large subunit ribosomal protein L15e
MPKRNTFVLEKRILENFKPTEITAKVIQRINSPIRPFRSRSIGYKNLPGYVVIIAKIKKGGIEPNIPGRGRKPTNIYKKYSRSISKIDILNERVSKKYKTLKMLGGYFLCETGSQKWYEFILKDQNFF